MIKKKGKPRLFSLELTLIESCSEEDKQKYINALQIRASSLTKNIKKMQRELSEVELVLEVACQYDLLHDMLAFIKRNQPISENAILSKFALSIPKGKAFLHHLAKTNRIERTHQNLIKCL